MDQWDPAKRDEGGKSLYGSMMRRVRAVGGKVAGMLWYQGESDALGEAQPAYRAKTRRFVEAVRRDLDAPDLPFIYVQIGPLFGDAKAAPAWNGLQNDQLEVEGQLGAAAMAACIDGDLTDIIHLNTASQRRLGRRLAHLAEMLVYDRQGGRTSGPRPVDATFEDGSRTVLRARYESVNGRLRPAGRISGFFVQSDGRQVPMRSQKVDPDRPDTVVIRFAEPVPPGSELWYGMGLNPAVNLVDDADMAAPVFGPMQI